MWIVIGAVAAGLTVITVLNDNLLAFGLLLSPLLLYIALKKPFAFPLGLFVMLIPFDSVLSVSEGAQGATLTRYIGMAAIIALMLKGAVERRLKMPDAVALWWVLLVAYGGLSVWWALDAERAQSRISTAAGLLLLYLVCSSFRLKKSEYQLMKWLALVGGAGAAIFTIYGYWKGHFYAGPDMRASLLIGERGAGPNQLAYDLLMPAAIGVAMLLTHKGKLFKALLLAVVVTIFAGIILTGSRGGLMGGVVVIAVYLIHVRKRLTFGIVSLAIGAILFFSMPGHLIERLAKAAETGGAGRLDIWHVGLLALKKYWLTGAGLNNFSTAYTEFAYYAPNFKGLGRAAHNIFLENFVQLGVIGFTLMAGGLYGHYRRISGSVISGGDFLMLKASFWAMMVSSLFLDTFWYKSTWLLWMMILMRKSSLEDGS